ncbi:MAG: hypothetical protein RL338_1225, partial [Chloroflexota bacterium]
VLDVLVDGVSQGEITSYTFTNITANRTISASFARLAYTITASAGLQLAPGTGGTISPSGAITVLHGDSTTFTMTPDPGYSLATVLIDGVPVAVTGNQYTFTNVTSDRTIEARFAAVVHTITATAGANGTISPVGAIGVAEGDSLTFAITPAPAYQVLDVLVDGVSVGDVTSYTFTDVTANHTIAATFALGTVTVTTSANAGGTISGSTTLAVGDSTTVTITPDTGYRIDDVLVDGVSVGAIDTVALTGITADATVEAVFARITFAIVATAGANGSIGPSTSLVIGYGDSTTFTITPDTGYRVLDVLVDGVSVGDVTSYTFTNVTANASISATFAIRTFTVTASAGTGGTISPSGATTVEYGASQAYTVAAGTGYQLVSVTANGSALPVVGGVATVANVTADTTVVASFTRVSYTITATAGTGGSISPASATVAHSDGTATFTVTPDAGFHVARVRVDGRLASLTGNQYTFTNVTANRTIAVTFEADAAPAPTPTTTTVSASATAVTSGDSVTISIAVDPSTATGTVAIGDGTDVDTSCTLVAGACSVTVTLTTIGTHPITVAYPGAGSTFAASSATVLVTVAAPTYVVPAAFDGTTFTAAGGAEYGSPTIAWAPEGTAGSPVVVFETITDGTNLLASTPFVVEGTNHYFDISITSGDGAAATGPFTVCVATSDPAARLWHYAGGAWNDVTVSNDGTTLCGVTDTLSPFVIAGSKSAATVAVVASDAAPTYGTRVSFTVEVAATGIGRTPTGTVTLLDGTTPIGTCALVGGSCTVATSGLAAGAKSIVATYSGDELMTATSGDTAVTVAKRATALSISGTTAALAGETLTYTVTLDRTAATGTVVVSAGATELGSCPLSAGTCVVTAASPGAGTYTVTAAYAGDGNHLGATAATPVTLTVTSGGGGGGGGGGGFPPIVLPPTQQAQTITFAPATAIGKGTKLALAAKASSGLTVTYRSGTPAICTVSGNVLTALAIGTCSVTASQAGDASWLAATPVTKAIAVKTAVVLTTRAIVGTTTVSANPATVKKGVKVTLTLTTSRALSGRVVEVWQRIGTGTWTKLTTRKVSTVGTASFAFYATRADVSYRWKFNGSTSLAPAIGSTRRFYAR